MFSKKQVVTGLLVAVAAAVVVLAAFAWGMVATAQSLRDAPSGASQVGPLVFSSYRLERDDDGRVECGTRADMRVTLGNQGDSLATWVSARISENDPYVTMEPGEDQSNYSDIPGGGTAESSSDYEYAVDASAPNGHEIEFSLNIEASNGGPWTDSFQVPVSCGSQGEVVFLYLPLVTAGP